jgi:RimJ/RimL family protein N-acetyltransferase
MMTPVNTDPALQPVRTTIRGVHVALQPLDAQAHSDALYEASGRPKQAALWQYVIDGPFPNRKSFDEMIQRKAASDDPLYFAIIDHRTGAAAGYAALMRIDPVHRVIEIGYILFTPALQRTTGATEAIYLLARYVFEDLHYRRFEWKCDSRNEPSRRAAVRFGFTYEGTFRQHMLIKGRNRDTNWFSIVDSEWPERKKRMEQWLAPENFDANGIQKQALSAL